MNRRIRFPDRRTGRVHIDGRLHVRTAVDIEISFAREAFAALLSVAPASVHLGALAGSILERLMIASVDYAVHHDPEMRSLFAPGPLPATLRRRLLTFSGTYEDDKTGKTLLEYRLAISPQHLRVVAGETSDALSREICLLLSDPDLVAGLQADHRPRGAHADAPTLLRSVRFALLETEAICSQRKTDPEFQATLQRLLGADYSKKDPKKDWHENALRLLDRAFRPAWPKSNVKSPTARLDDGDAPRDVSRSLLSSAERRALRALFKTWETATKRDWAHQMWRGLLLGPEGEAARDFDL